MDIERIRDLAVPVLQRHGIVKAFLFGSFARGEQTERSDVDILIEYAPGVRKSLLTRAKIIQELREVFQRNVDVVTEGSLSPHFRENVLRERRAIL
ncbi:nucleotidyltransferase family protein [Desulfovirgula thermocuniculi]|uniref:nucleotidyltransferase family protein n=1 Tax=Desulfovirgula thermocuniculi TaxID=348842 RepID=UPI0006884891|nr:nucleotidyltransferase family protein [Desulfovirgula thermocuniculi]